MSLDCADEPAVGGARGHERMFAAMLLECALDVEKGRRVVLDPGSRPCVDRAVPPPIRVAPVRRGFADLLGC